MSGELERFDPAEQRGRIAYEHLHRYALCAQHVAGKRVLDLGCGTGYGTAIVGAQGAQVTGADISATAIRLAKLRYGSDNVTFVMADCFDLPFAAASFDVVVANEMIEHVADHDALITEARRVLVPGGLLLVSTPNKPVYNRFKTPNVFHISEMDQPEFMDLLGRHFRHVRLTGTRMALLSVGYPLDESPQDNLGAARIFNGSVSAAGQPELLSGEFGLADPEYLLAACSDEPLEALAVESSLYLSRDDDLWLEHERIMAWASQLHDEDELLRADVMRLRDELARERTQLVDLRADNQRLDQQAADLRHGNGAREQALAQALERTLETNGRDADSRRSLLARLVGQASGGPVDADDTEIVAGLFSLNEQLFTARLRGELAEEKAAREAAAHADAKAATAQAEARSANLTETVAALQRDLATGNDVTAHMKAELSMLTTSNDAMAAERDQLAAEVNRAHQLLAASEQIKSHTLTALERVQGDVDQLTQDLATTGQALSEREAELAVTRATFEAIEAELAATRTEVVSTQVELAATKTAFETTEAELAATRTELASTQVELAATRTAFEFTDTELASTRGELATAHSKITNAHSELASAHSEINSMRKGAAALEPPPELVRRRERLAMVHQQVAGALASAPAQVAGRIGPPPPPPPRNWQQQLLGRPAPLSTIIFDAEWVKRQRPGLSRVSLATYLADPALHSVDPHPLFAASAYLAANPDVAAEAMAPLAHYVMHGWREGRNPHPLFANDWYLAQHPDVAADGGISPLDHYLQHGWREGRWPNPLFDPRAYLDRYPDVAAAGVDPFTHFIAHGQHEGRETQFRGWDPDWLGLLGNAIGSAGLMRHIMTVQPPQPFPPVPVGDLTWPPKPLDDFWPAQAMRDFILDGYGETVLYSSWYLMSLMQRWQDRQIEFAASQDCRNLMGRLRQRAALRTLPAGREPDASIIIPVYNNALDTLICIASLLELEEAHDYEVIVADDGSSDSTALLVGAIGGCVRHLQQSQNLGFLGNCNSAALQARGRHIVLLNNDTLLFPNWLDGLLEPFSAFEHVGFVGSKLVNWDGTLQEAGGIFWRDGSAWNFGRNQDARAPEFSYLKDVDYCSGASIAVPAAIWREMGGFDQAYTPAYCEDSDLAFRLREAGYRTLYSPASEVVHHEGRSHGRDLTSGIKAYQVTNNLRFLESWRHVLERDHYPNGQNVLRARDRSFTKRHVLVIDHYVPQWDKDAGSRTIYQYMKLLIDAGCSVSFWPDNLWRDPKYTPGLQQMGVEVITGPNFVGGFAAFIQERGELYDMVLISRPHVAKSYLTNIRQHSSASIVYYGQDLHFRRMEAAAALGEPVTVDEIDAMRQLELAVCRGSDVIFYPDPDEVALIEGLVGGDREFIANPVFVYRDADIAQSRARLADVALPARGRMLFVGGFNHTPNRQGIIWFVREVLPLVQMRWPGATLDIIGSNPPGDVSTLAGDAVRILGFVSDAELEQAYVVSDLAVAPLRFGAGVKGKVIEAMAKAVPVATTSIGAQGIDDADARLFVGDTPQDLANAIILALQDRGEAQKRSRSAIDFIAQNYSEDAMRAVFERLIKRKTPGVLTK